MQKLLLLVLVAFLITSCTNKFARIYETKTITDMTMDNGYYHFQNDTFSIHYSFWANKGVLSYTIYNKLNIPVYLDWKKSSFVKNNEKFDYWMDELNTNTLSYYRGNALSGVYYTGLDLIPILTASSGRSSSVSKTKATKPERITFLAPKSQIFKAQFIIYNNEPKEMNGFITSSIDNPLNAKKKIDIKSVKFNLNNSPIFFRNFFTYSTSEKFETEAYIDNGFYVSRIVEMKQGQFFGKGVTNPSEGYTYQFPFKNYMYYYVLYPVR